MTSTHKSDVHPPVSRPCVTRDRTVLGLCYRSISLSSGEIGYIDEGSGAPILLLHGAPLTALGFLRVICELRTNYRVIAPDLPGFGGSTAAAGFSGTLRNHSEFVEEFCRALGLRHFFAYVNDSSACIAFPALANLNAEVAGLIVADTVPLPMTGPFQIVKAALKYGISSPPVRWINRTFNLFPWMVVRVAPFMNAFSKAERDVLIAQFDTRDKRDRIINIFSQMARDDAFMRLASRSAQETLADRPTLLLYGQFDPMRLLGGVSRFQRIFQNNTVRIVPFEEHFPILASGARVGRMVHEWIQGRIDK